MTENIDRERILHTTVKLVLEGREKTSFIGYTQLSDDTPEGMVRIGAIPGLKECENDFTPFDVDVQTLIEEGVHGGFRIIGIRRMLRLPELQ